MWPNHCIQNTFGSELAQKLKKSMITKIIYKGTDPEIDSYSGFFDNGHLKSTELDNYLKSKKITDLYIMGLATDYCVKFTAIDAYNLGYNTFLIKDGTRGVNINKSDSEAALKEMKELGITIIESGDI
jgi:nicotinamidase/pyrazinamidase